MSNEEQPKDFNDSCENTLVKESEDTAQIENKTKPKSNIFSFKGRGQRRRKLILWIMLMTRYMVPDR